MTRRFIPVLAAAVISALLAPAVYSQENSEKPLGDVARELRKAQDKKPSPGTVIHNRDIASPGEASPQPPPSPTAETATSGKAAEVTKKALVNSSVFDRSDLKEPTNFQTVPAGTRIPVDLLRNNVSEPVRLGFATPVPALSHAEVQFSADYYYVYDPESGTTNPWAAACSVQLTALTLGGVSYAVQTDTVPAACINAGEVTFTLTSPLKIPN